MATKQTLPGPSSPKAQAPAGSPLEQAWTSGNEFFSSLWDYSSPVANSIQQVATSSTSTTSLPSSPSPIWGLVPSSPNYMQHYTIPLSAVDPFSSFRDSANGKRKKIPRPPNAFMLFRSWLIRSGELPSDIKKHQQNVSKIAGQAWKLLDEPSKDKWREEALQLVQDWHDVNNKPDSRKSRAGLGRIKKIANDTDDDNARRLKALTDFYSRDHRAVGYKRPRRERPSPYKPSFEESFPETPAWPYQTHQLAFSSQAGSPSIPPLINFDPLQPPAQSLSPLPFGSQLNDFIQGMQQNLPTYTFPAMGHSNNPSLAYEGEDGKIVFPDTYAPVNPLPLPSYRPMVIPVGKSDERTMIVPTLDTAATALGLYELSSPYAHFNPGLDASGNDLPVHDPLVQAPPNPPISNAPTDSLSTAPLTTREQQVFDAILENLQQPLALGDLVSSPLFYYDDALTSAINPAVELSPQSSPTPPHPAEEHSFANSPTGGD